MANSFKADLIMVEKLVSYYGDISMPIDNLNILFKGSTDEFTILIYTNFTVLFQGKKATIEIKKWIADDIEQKEIVIDHIGSDEVGCGDYFGPIVVSACLVTKQDYDYLYNIKVRDSKQLTDEKIKEIAPLIIDRIPSVTFVLSNQKYNEIHEKNAYNLNKIKAYLHNFVLFKLTNKYNEINNVVIDQFCSKENYFKYLRDYKTKDVFENVTFETKAENKYLAVACASIVARYQFLNQIDSISKEVGYKVILGANDEVDKLAKKILDEKGFEYLSKYVKVHFKNTEKIITM